MSLVNDSFAELRKNLPVEPMEPSAPIYAIRGEYSNVDKDVKEKMSLCKSSPEDDSTADTAVSLKMMKIELDVKKARLRKEQLEKERKLVDEDFRVRIELVDSEIAVSLAKLESLHESFNSTPTNGEGNVSAESNKLVSPSSPKLSDIEDFDRLNTHKMSGINKNVSGTSAGVPAVFNSVGLEQLRVLDCLSIRQLRSRDPSAEEYEVVAPGEDLVVFRANVTVGLVGRQRDTRVVFIDNQVNEVITFQKSLNKGMELRIGGQLVSRVQRKPTFLKPMLEIFDSHGTPVLRLKGDYTPESIHIFRLQTTKKSSIGILDKRPVHPTAQYEANHAIIQFPLDLDVRYKATVIAANFLIYSRNIGEIRQKKFKALEAASIRMEHRDLTYPRLRETKTSYDDFLHID